MELPFVYIDPREPNEDIANIAPFLVQARRILANNGVSDEMKKTVFDIAMESIGDVTRYYEAKAKESQLLKKDPEIDQKLHQAERELSEKERNNSELRASNQEKKRNIQFSEMMINRSRTKTSDLLRQRKELEEECKKLSNEVEQNNVKWDSVMQTARNQRDRLQTLMDQSPRLAKQNIEQNTVTELEKRLEGLNLECTKLEQEETRLKNELKLQLATSLNVFVVSFARATLRTLDMQKKLDEAKRIYEELKAEELERRKSGASDYDGLDASFMSVECGLKKAPDHLSQTELLAPMTTSRTVEPADEESASTGTLTSESSNKSPPAQPPQSTEEEVIRARTNAVENYVTQQSESISMQAESHDNDNGEVIRNEIERGSICDLEKIGQLHGMDVEAMSVSDEQNDPAALDNESVNGSIDEGMDLNGSQEIALGDFSDDEVEPEDVDEGGCAAMEDDNEEGVVQEQEKSSQRSVGCAKEEAIFRGNRDCMGTVTTTPTKETTLLNSFTDRKDERVLHRSHQKPVEITSAESLRERLPHQNHQRVFSMLPPHLLVWAQAKKLVLFSALC
ncbi:hypothetical protein KIN20_033542 [Parelaphostrongylus tenuis]|uniref:Uncharacterized protein n=1 Tax=Parelaphostrongylus tenuis TaxID=148309 RepID=A0AAD5WIW0_PARTN|nr:hypothetical protein KIN20_033542 [Parelaphostrongylus tenuis]